MLACGAIGFVDDWIKLHHRRSLGLSGRWKMLLLAGIATAVGVAAHHQKLGHSVFVPIIDRWVPLGWGWYLLVFVVIAGAANAVNLTDGLDGLAAGHLDHRPLHPDGDGGDDLHPLARPEQLRIETGSTPRSSARR